MRLDASTLEKGRAEHPLPTSYSQSPRRPSPLPATNTAIRIPPLTVTVLHAGARWTSTFVASLELAKQGEIVLQQDKDFSPIQVSHGSTTREHPDDMRQSQDVPANGSMGEMQTLAEAILVTAAVCGARTKGTYLRDKFHRLRARMGAKKAAMVVAHKILVAAFHMLNRATASADLDADYLDHIDKHRTVKRLARRLDALGYAVMLRPKPAN